VDALERYETGCAESGLEVLAGSTVDSAGKLMIKEIVSRATMQPARVAYRRIRLLLDRRRNARGELADVFDRIYAQGRWGGEDGEFVSGYGSDDDLVTDYVEAVATFIRSQGVGSIVDLGCGDFRVARRILSSVNDHIRYVGVDIVPALIERNQALFGSERVRFLCKDITRDHPPIGELCLVRQVFQHLSNVEIADALACVQRYRYALVTEHYPAPERLRGPNYDKPHGGDTRVVDGSAVFLDKAPFKLAGLELFCETEVNPPLVAKGETLKTWLIRQQS
jgi:SAM-dependent methyltransferase